MRKFIEQLVELLLLAAVIALSLMALLYLAGNSVHGAEPRFRVVDRTTPRTRFVVADQTTVIPAAPSLADGGTGDLPNRAAPAGYAWERWQGQPWTLYKIATVSGVADPRPFFVTRTPAQPAAGFSTPSTPSTVTAPTGTAAPWMALPGATNGCANGNCPAPPRRGLFR